MHIRIFRFPQWGARYIGLMESLVTFIGIAGCAFLALWSLTPPAPLRANAPANVFSAERAHNDLRVIAQTPHPIGSQANQRVRDYIVQRMRDMGVTASIQHATRIGSPPVVENILAKLPGVDSTRALLLVAHYDSVPTGPGASDNGVAVVALLETLRALRAMPPALNDVIFLFTDGEEKGFVGAQEFVQHHPWAREVGYTFNFDARGTGGPSLMFETSPGNGWLIRMFAQSAPHPVASSVFYAIYQYQLNRTDFTILKSAGLAGMNFAFIDGMENYHTPTDDLKHLDERSLQHHGENALGLVKNLANIDLGAHPSDDFVYFNTLGSGFVYYSTAWVLPLAIVDCFMFFGVLAILRRRKSVSGRQLLRGALFSLANLVGIPAFFALLWRLIQALTHTKYVCNPFYMLSFCILNVAIVSAILLYTEKKTPVISQTLGMCWWCLLLTGVASWFIPSGSYVFSLPLLFCLLGIGASEIFCSSSRFCRLVILILSALPCVVLLTPIIYLCMVALTLNLVGIPIVLATLLSGLLLPNLVTLDALRRGWLSVACTVIVLGLLVAGSNSSVIVTTNVLSESCWKIFSPGWPSMPGIWKAPVCRASDVNPGFYHGPPETPITNTEGENRCDCSYFA